MYKKDNENLICSFSKIHFDPTCATLDDISISDIAHALSLMTRANGHFPTFYSVAQHSILCSKESIKREYGNKVSLFCLLHDASEAYLSDITRPIKKRLTEYKTYEKRLQDTIYLKFLNSLPNETEEKMINDIDDSALYDEFSTLMNEEVMEKKELKLTPNYDFVPFIEVEKEFLSLYETLKMD